MKFTKEQISTIAEEVDTGMKCYMHKKTGAIHTILDVDPEEYYEMTGEKEEFQDELENNFTSYIRIDKMDSTESYRVMESFVASRSNGATKQNLINALNGRKPFRNFTDKLIGSDYDIRDEWFAYKDIAYEKYVKMQLDEKFEG